MRFLEVGVDDVCWYSGAMWTERKHLLTPRTIVHPSVLRSRFNTAEQSRADTLAGQFVKVNVRPVSFSQNERGCEVTRTQKSGTTRPNLERELLVHVCYLLRSQWFLLYAHADASFPSCPQNLRIGGVHYRNNCCGGYTSANWFQKEGSRYPKWLLLSARASRSKCWNSWQVP